MAYVDVSNCGRKPIAYGPRVRYGRQRIVVTFFIPAQRFPNRSIACTLEQISYPESIALSEPIGTRDLYDGGAPRPRLVWRNPAAK